MADKLLPCPFCGGEAEIKECFFTGFHKALFIAKCKNIGCGAIGSECVTKESAVNAWNRRSDWHTGTPTEEGDYLVQYKNSGHDVLHFADLSWFAFNRGGVEWQKIPDSSVIRWQKIEED